MQKRIKKVTQLLKSEKADALLVWNSEGGGQPATEWLSGFSGTASVVLIIRKTTTPSLRLFPSPSFERSGGRHHVSCFLITDGRYTAQAKKEAKGFTVFVSSAQKPTLRILSEIIRKNKLRKILFDGSVTAHSVVEDMKECLSHHPLTPPHPRRGRKTTPLNPPSKEGGKGIQTIEFISQKHILQELRVVKDKEEIQVLTKSAEIAWRAFTRLLPEIHAGMTEKEIAKRLEDLMSEEGAEGIAFPTIVASGKNGALPHAVPTDKKIQNGELVTIDFGARYRGYMSDITRTVAIGKISIRLKKMYEAVQEAQELGCKKAKAGMTGEEIDAVCRDYLKKKGFGNYFTHSTGHGIGMEVHELPRVSPHHPSNPLLRKGEEERKERLPAGAVITCEPGVYIPNVGGVRIEDSLVLTKNGSINLTEGVSKDLTVI